jgi:Zn-dependent protease/CBS domain-containing protein
VAAKKPAIRGARAGRRPGIRLGSLFGIEIRLDFSVAIIFGLVVFTLATGVFPSWHGDWSAGLTWGVALAAGLLFFASLLAHELAHSVVAKSRGIAVPRITLFVFGGASEMESEPDTPASEFLIAIVGPATSILLGVVFGRIGAGLAGAGFAERVMNDPQTALASLGPWATLLVWLGPVNVILGIFNLIPGFPLDGGRVLRALVWWATGDLERATRAAATAGSVFAWGLMGLGVWQVLQGAVLQGAWLMLIGWFLQSAAKSSQMQAALRRAVAGLRVRDLMRTQFDVVEPGMKLDAFVNERVLHSGQQAWPVVDSGRLVGMVSLDDVRERLSRGAGGATVADAMRPAAERLAPGVGGRQALEMLLRSRAGPLPVVEGERIVGLLHGDDIMRWLAVHQLNINAG